MVKKTQKEWVKECLERDGSISRNQALGNFVSRLGAIACDLRQDGWELEGKWRGNDYVYSLITKPVKPLTPNQEISRKMEEQLAIFN